MKLDGERVIITATFDRNSILYNGKEIGLFFCRDIYDGHYIQAEVAILWKEAMREARLEWKDINHFRDVMFDVRMSRFAFPADQRAEAKIFHDCILRDGEFQQSRDLIIVEYAQFDWKGKAEKTDIFEDYDE